MPARITVLGRFALTAEDGTDISPGGKKAKALLGMLALAPGMKLSRRFVADILWNKPTDNLVNLRQLLSEISGHLQTVGADILAADRDDVWLIGDAVTADIVDLAELGAAPEIPKLLIVKAMAYGELLSGIDVRDRTFIDWLEEQRANVRRQAILVFEAALSAAERAGEAELQEAAAHRILEVEPTREDAYRVLMRVCAERGDARLALAHFRNCVDVLQNLEERGVEPETQALCDEIEAGRLEKPQTPVTVPAAMPTARFEQRTVLFMGIGSIAGRAEHPQEVANADTIRDSLCLYLSDASWLFKLVDDMGNFADVDYQLTGSVRQEGSWTRVVMRLIRVADRRLIWARNFDLDDDHPFRQGEKIAIQLAESLERDVLVAEITRTAGYPEEELAPHDRMMRAIPSIFRLSHDSVLQAEGTMRDVMAQLPGLASPMSWLAVINILKIGQGWSADAKADAEELDWLTRTAVEFAPDDPLALAVSGHYSSFVAHRFEHALDLFERAHVVSPYSAYAKAFSALTYCYIGNTTEARKRLTYFRKAWPNDPYPHFFDTARAIAESMAGNHAEAMMIARRTIETNPNFNATFRPLISSLGHLGFLDEAAELTALLREREPYFSLDWFRSNYPLTPTPAHEAYFEGFAKAGVPRT